MLLHHSVHRRINSGTPKTILRIMMMENNYYGR